MLSKLSLKNFRGFYRFDITFRKATVLIGPNNAGKSTIVGALRAADLMLRHARARNPLPAFLDSDIRVYGYPISPSGFGLDEDSLRFDSREDETRFDLQFANGSALHAVWGSSGAPGFFHLTRRDQPPPRTAGAVRTHFSPIGVIPPLTPVERTEALLDPATLQAAYHTRRSSRHLRNNLYALTLPHRDEKDSEFAAFLRFAAPWLPELTLETPVLIMNQISLNYWEGLGWREVSWAGDGLQVFIQFLYHCYRLRDGDSIVIDEPDIYLHADLQRKLMRVLETIKPQFVLATHAAEIATEAPPRATVWVDRDRPRAVSAESHPDIEGLIDLLGIHFNLRLAPLLRARTAVFVEGDDSKVLRAIARTLGKKRILTETDIAIVPIKGSSNWRRTL